MTASVYDRDGFFASYQKLRSNPNSVNEVIEKPTMLALLADLQGKRVLDLGCGCGGHLQLYLRRGAEYVAGVDLSVRMLQEAERILAAERQSQKLAEKRPHFSLYHLSMEHLEQLPESGFDVITSSFAMHYIRDFPALLTQIRDKLTANGILVFSQEHPITTCHKEGERWEKGANKEQRAYRLQHYREEGERDRNWFNQPFKTYHRTTATIINRLLEAGFMLERIEEPMLAQQPEWHQEFKDLQHRPPLLFVKARKTT